jgi:hypothetical protein
MLVVLSGCLNKESKSDGEFTVGNISTNDFISGETYFLVMPIEWSGSNTAVIDSVTIEIDDTEIQDTQGISYEFFVGDPNKQHGVYARDDIGEMQNIQGYEIKDKGTLILKVVLSKVNKNDDRHIKINYSVDGDKKEQIIATQTVEGFSTK